MHLELSPRGGYRFGHETLPQGIFCPRAYFVLCLLAPSVVSRNGELYQAKEGDLFSLTPEDLLYFPLREGAVCLSWRFAPEDLFGDTSVFAPILGQGAFFPQTGQSQDVISLAERACNRADQDFPTGESADLISRMMLSELLLHLPECTPATVGEGKVARTADYLARHFTEQISLDDLSRDIEVSKYYLCRAFRRDCGLTPHAYLNLLRILRADALIALGVGAMASGARVGFRDYTTFFRSYRKVFGCAPSGAPSPEEA